MPEPMPSLPLSADAILNTVRHPMLILDAHLVVCRANHSFCSTFSVIPHRTLGRRIYEIGEGEWDVPDLRNLLQTLLPQRLVVEDFEISFDFPSIGHRILRVSARRVSGDRDHSSYILLALEDVTEQRGMEQRRMEIEARFDSVVNSIPDHAIFTLDCDGRIAEWNRQAATMLGYTETEAIGLPYSSLFTFEDQRAGIPHQRISMARNQGRIEEECWHVRKGGDQFWVLEVVTSAQDCSGVHTGYTKFLCNLTDRRKAEEALRRQTALLQAVNDTTTELIYVKDVTGRLIYANAATLRTIGLTAEQAFGALPGEKFSVPVDHTNNDRQVLQSGQRLTFEEPYECADGEHRNFLTTKNPWRDENNQIIGVIGVSLDITARKKSEGQLAAELAAVTRLHDLSTRLLSAGNIRMALQDVLKNAILTCGADFGNIQIFDPRSGELEIVAQQGFQSNFLEYFRTVPLNAGSACAQAMQAGQRIIIEDVECDTAFAPHRAIAAESGFRAVQSTPLKAHDGSIVGMLSTHYREPHHPTERDQRLLDLYARHAADMIQRSQLEQALKDANRRKDEFLATLAHELRNPLAPIRNSLQLLKVTSDPLLWGRSRDMIERQLEQMVRLVDDLLDINRITRNKLELRRADIDLWTVIQSAVETARPQIEARSHTLTVTLPSRPIPLHADLTRLAQVFSNLLNNSAKYTEKGGQISLIAEEQNGEAVVTVQDNGIGLAAESIPGLFNIFSQVDHTLERAQGGLGIGLALVKGLTESHGGSVEVRSPGIGHGCTFIVRLPITARTSPRIESSSPVTGPVVKGRILIVDDNRDGAESLATLLMVTGHETRMAHDGSEGLRLAEEFRPDLIVLDIGMPNLNGYDVCREIRRLPWGQGILIVAVTGWGQDEDRRRSRDAGFNHHFVKPVDPTELNKLLAQRKP